MEIAHYVIKRENKNESLKLESEEKGQAEGTWDKDKCEREETDLMNNNGDNH